MARGRLLLGMPEARPSTPHRNLDVFDAALLKALSNDAGSDRIEAGARARVRALAVSLLRRGLLGLEAMVTSAGHRTAAALRAVRCAAPAALLALSFGAIPAAAEREPPAILLMVLGEGNQGMLSVPMHVDTRGLPAVVVVHDEPGRSSGADRYVEKLLALGLPVLEIAPFPRPTDSVMALPRMSDVDAATQVSLAAEALALAEGLDPHAIGALGFGAGAHAVLLARPAANGRVLLSARVLVYPGCEMLRRPILARLMAVPGYHAPGKHRAAPSFADAVRQEHVLLLYGGRDAGNTQASCAALAADLAMAADVHHVVMPEVGHACTRVGQGAMVGPTALPVRGALPGQDETAFAAETVSVFLADALSTMPLRGAAR